MKTYSVLKHFDKKIVPDLTQTLDCCCAMECFSFKNTNKDTNSNANNHVPLANMGKCFSFIIRSAKILTETGFSAADSAMHWLPATDSAMRYRVTLYPVIVFLVNVTQLVGYVRLSLLFPFPRYIYSTVPYLYIFTTVMYLYRATCICVLCTQYVLLPNIEFLITFVYTFQC